MLFIKRPKHENVPRNELVVGTGNLARYVLLITRFHTLPTLVAHHHQPTNHHHHQTFPPATSNQPLTATGSSPSQENIIDAHEVFIAALPGSSVLSLTYTTSPPRPCYCSHALRNIQKHGSRKKHISKPSSLHNERCHEVFVSKPWSTDHVKISKFQPWNPFGGGEAINTNIGHCAVVNKSVPENNNIRRRVIDVRQNPLVLLLQASKN